MIMMVNLGITHHPPVGTVPLLGRLWPNCRWVSFYQSHGAVFPALFVVLLRDHLHPRHLAVVARAMGP